MDKTTEKQLEKVLAAVRSRKIEACIPLPPVPLRRLIREAAGLTHSDLADLFGLTKQGVRLWEVGAVEPQGERRIRYRDILVRLAREVVRTELERGLSKK